ncbi:hypothetical protein [Streptomyces sp. NPDC058155]|uniref:hypothetical protein n=1 Tax=Streptomyces sp. NPDC058155 TaxID=3346359 RepID=UPI0036EF5201
MQRCRAPVRRYPQRGSGQGQQGPPYEGVGDGEDVVETETYTVLDVLGEWPEATEADLAHHYPEYGPGGPVAAYWRGEITLRWLRVMAEGLPPTGALARAAAGHHWTHADWAAADSRDLLDMLLVAFANAHRGEKDPAVPWPEPTWRPGDPLPQDTAAVDEEKRAQARAAYERINAQVLPGR